MFEQNTHLLQAPHHYVEEFMENGLVKRYIKGKTLGKGGFAQCFEFISEETGKIYAAKVINKQSLLKGKAKQKLQSQILIHKSLKHKNIVKFQHFFQDQQNVYILLQLCNQNTLIQLQKRRKILTELQVKYYVSQLIHAVKYIHQHKIIHRDLKLGNIFLSGQLQIKIGDFGLATTINFQGQRRKTVCGTPNYIAPQILQNKKGHSYEVDIWSIGVITFTLLFGKPPFQTNQVKLTYEKIKVCDFTFPRSNVSDQAKNFISKMLVLNPAQRATPKQLLSHTFLNNEPIPRSLPKYTLACPPNLAFIKQTRQQSKEAFVLEPSQDRQRGLTSSRTSKNSLVKYKKSLMSTQKLTDLMKLKDENHITHAKIKSGSLARAISMAVLPPNKKTVANQKQQKHLHATIKQPKIRITQFEQQSKYGMYYKLTNGSISMRFNDLTCLISNSKLNQFRYVVLQKNIQTQNKIYSVNQIPEIIKKKYKILAHFLKQTKAKSQSTGQPVNPISKIKQQKAPSSVYIIYYATTNQSTFFWFNNDVCQQIFKDGSQLTTENQNALFIDKDKNKTFFKKTDSEQQTSQIKVKYQHLQALIKKAKKIKHSPSTSNTIKNSQEEKQNPTQKQMGHSISTSKLIIKHKNASMTRRPFSSSTNILQKINQNFNSHK